jgi:hypothetical protein
MKQLCPAIFALLLSACSINNMATKAVADALSSSSSNSFAQDDDLELVGQALPFAIKMYETILASNPDHIPLNATVGSISIMYANAFIEHPANKLLDSSPQQARAGLLRAKKFYLRGLAYLERAMNLRLPGWQEIKADKNATDRALAKLKPKDSDLLYWYSAGLLSAWAIDPMDISLGLRLPEAKALLKRAEVLVREAGPKEDTAIDEAFLSLYASLPEEMGGSEAEAHRYYQIIMEKTQGKSASARVSLASSLAVRHQDYPEFKRLLEEVLAIEADKTDKDLLMLILAKEKAELLLSRAEFLFWDLGDSEFWSDEDDAEF